MTHAQVQTKLFYVDLKENGRGKYLKIAEKGKYRPKSSIVIPISGLSSFMQLFDFYISTDGWVGGCMRAVCGGQGQGRGKQAEDEGVGAGRRVWGGFVVVRGGGGMLLLAGGGGGSGQPALQRWV